MAQQDTGLGWSAKDSWLMQTAGQLAEIQNISGGYVLDIIPNATYADIMSVSDWIFYRPAQGYRDGVKAVSIDGLVFGFIHQANNGVWTPYFISKNQDAKVRWAWNSSGPYTETPSFAAWVDRPGWFYVNMGVGISSSTTRETPLPVYTGSWQTAVSAAIDALQISVVDIYKTNPGFAVACIAKWRTSADVVIESPILISTDANFTDMSASGAYQFARYRARRDGMTFYMSFYQDLSGELTSLLQKYDISSPEEPYANLDELFNLICAPDQANVLVTEPTDPYEDFPPTGEDAGDPDPDPEDDDIEEEDLPTMSFATAGFCRIYRPSFSQVSALASYMWTDQNFLQTVINHLKQILENPIDAIISLSIVPCVPNVLADEEVKVMYVPTGVYMPPVQRQFVSVDCGSYKLTEMYGSALDYNPYTSVQLYLPYIGVVQLDTDEVMGKTISIGYRIDVVTGVCCAYVKANNDILYQFSGHCSIHQPITSADFSGYINAALAAGKLVASIAAAGAGAPAVAATLAGAPTPSISGTESKTVETERNPNTGRQITVGTRKRESQTYNPGASFGEVATRGVSNTVGAVMNSKTIIQHSGGFSGNSGFMAAVRRPYLIVTRPRIANPENYGKYNGRPSMIYLNLGDCTGFTQVQSIQLTGIDATNPELSEIVTLLNAGVIL